MKIDRQALIFAVIILAIVGVVGGFVWFSALFKTTGEGERSPIENFFSSLFPFGTTTRPGDGGGTGNGTGPEGPTPTLRQVTGKPTSGFTYREGNILRYIERETGHVFETPFDSWKTTRISNTTIPGAYAIAWLPPDSFVMQYFAPNGTTRNFLATLASSTPDQTLLGRFLDQATEIYPSPKEGEMIRVRKGANGTVVDRVKTESGESETVFSSGLRSWQVIPSGTSLYVGTSPSSVDGFLFRVSGESLEKIVGSVRSLSSLPHTEGRYIAYSSGLALGVLDTEEDRFYPAQVNTFADKCSWFPAGRPLLFCGVPAEASASLEAWHMGVQPLSDSAWVIDPMRGTATIVSHLDLDAGRAIDVWKPVVSPDGSYAAFMDKNDLSLWLLKLP